jgi:hypothetical protein
LAVSIAVATVHLAVGLSCHETLAGFLVLEGLWMFCFGLMAGNFGTLAMEPMGHIAATLAVVALAERGRLFQPGRDAKADASELLLQGGGS